MKKSLKNVGLMNDQAFKQFCICAADTMVNYHRQVVIAYRTMSPEQFEEFNKFVEENVQKICYYEKKDVNLQTKKDVSSEM